MASPTLMQVFAAADAGVPLGQPALDLVSVPLERIVPSRWQPRQQFDPDRLLDLANDIAQHGVLTPPLVWQNEDMEYELIAGERRIRACYALALANYGAGMKSVDQWMQQIAAHGFVSLREQMGRLAVTFPQKVVAVQCREVWGKPEMLHELALVDNLQRADLTPIEEAHALHDLIQEYNYSQRDLAGRLGKSQTWISQRLNLLNLAPEVAEQVVAGELDSATAREIARLEQPVQAAAVAHLKKFNLRSKAGANLVGKIIELADPETLVTDTPVNRTERHLAQIGMAELPDIAARQAAIIKMAGMDSKGALGPIMAESHRLRDLIAITGLAGADATRYTVDSAALWSEQAPRLELTCEHCSLADQRALIDEINQAARAHQESYRNDEAWPQCAPDIQTCRAFTPRSGTPGLPLGWMRNNVAIREEDQPFVLERASGFMTATDPTVWAGILRRKYATEDRAAATRIALKEGGLSKALAEYVEANQTADFAAVHFWSQPCHRCVYHKVGSSDPHAACNWQAEPPAWQDYDALVARLWRSGNAPLIGRCKLFRLKSPVENLFDLPGGGLDLSAEGLLYVLRWQSTNNGYNAERREGARWLDVKRTRAYEPPSWTDSVEYVRKLIPLLTPGQRLALLLLWSEPFTWTSYHGDNKNEAAVYVPSASAVLNYVVERNIDRR